MKRSVVSPNITPHNLQQPRLSEQRIPPIVIAPVQQLVSPPPVVIAPVQQLVSPPPVVIAPLQFKPTENTSIGISGGTIVDNSNDEEDSTVGTPPQERTSYNWVQVRIGKQDTALLLDLRERLSSIRKNFNATIDEYEEFIDRKLQPKEKPRIDMATLCQRELREIYDVINDNSYFTQSNHQIIQNPTPRIFWSNYGRPFTNVRQGSKRVGPFCTAIVMYYNPQPCFTPINGIRCSQYHRTIFEYCQWHPQYKPSQMNLSHLCHDRRCVNAEHLVIETDTTNKERNSCRGQCSCGGTPKCIF